MNDSNKIFWALTCCVLIIIVYSGFAVHDISIINDAQIDMELSFYLQTNDNMTKFERYELALLISKEAYNKISDDLWMPLFKDKWIKNNAFELMKIS